MGEQQVPRDRAGEWLQEHEDYLEGKLPYEELQKRNAERYRELAGGPIVCDAAAFNRAADASIAHYRNRRRHRRLLIAGTVASGAAVLAGLYLTVVLIADSSVGVGIMWALITLMNVMNVYQDVRKLRAHDSEDA